MSLPWTFESDLSEILAGLNEEWPQLEGAHIFLTGGTGFIGRLLLEALKHAHQHRNLDLRVTILTRDVASFKKKAPQLTQFPAFSFIEGNVLDFKFPVGDFTHLIHAATDASAALNDTNPKLMFDTVLEGTRRALDFAVEKKIPRILNLSSGAVYGAQPWEMMRIKEDWYGAPDCRRPVNAYAEGKRAAEMLCVIYEKQFGLSITTARIFALLGPYLALDAHFAAGNFIRDAMAGKKIIVNSSGSAVRSYLYASDLIIMLLTLLLRGSAGKAYNIGSPEGISIRELAIKVAQRLGDAGFEILGKEDLGWNPGRYVPDMDLFKKDFGLTPKVSLDQAILRTAAWNGWKS